MLNDVAAELQSTTESDRTVLLFSLFCILVDYNKTMIFVKRLQ